MTNNQVQTNSNNIVIMQNEINDLTHNFKEQLNKLDEAIKLTDDAKKLAKDVTDKGFWGSLSGGFTGSNTKDIAKSIGHLGASVEIIQGIIQIILQVNNAKNQFLRGFHDALSDKIINLEDDLRICYGNDKSGKEATLIIAQQLRAQIEDKIKYNEMLDEHDEVIDSLKSRTALNDKIDEEQNQHINSLFNFAEEKDKIDIKQNQQLEEIDQKISILTEESTEHLSNYSTVIREISKLQQKYSDIELKNTDHEKLILEFKESLSLEKRKNLEQSEIIDSLTSELADLKYSFESHADEFFQYRISQNSFKSRLKRYTLPSVSLLIALFALIKVCI